MPLLVALVVFLFFFEEGHATWIDACGCTCVLADSVTKSVH